MLSRVLAVRFCVSSVKQEVVTDKMAPDLNKFISVVSVLFKVFTVNDLFSAQCAKQSLFLFNIC